MSIKGAVETANARAVFGYVQSVVTEKWWGDFSNHVGPFIVTLMMCFGWIFAISKITLMYEVFVGLTVAGLAIIIYHGVLKVICAAKHAMVKKTYGVTVYIEFNEVAEVTVKAIKNVNED
jgi:hypothetical protein